MLVAEDHHCHIPNWRYPINGPMRHISLMGVLPKYLVKVKLPVPHAHQLLWVIVVRANVHDFDGEL